MSIFYKFLKCFAISYLYVILYFILQHVCYFLEYNYFNGNYDEYKNKNILIIGGTEGLGYNLSIILNSLPGTNITIAARTLENLERLSKIHGYNYIRLDVQNIDKNINFKNYDIIFYCVGKCLPGYISSLSVEEYKESMNINYFGFVRLLKSLVEEIKVGDHSLVKKGENIDKKGENIDKEDEKININKNGENNLPKEDENIDKKSENNLPKEDEKINIDKTTIIETTINKTTIIETNKNEKNKKESKKFNYKLFENRRKNFSNRSNKRYNIKSINNKIVSHKINIIKPINLICISSASIFFIYPGYSSYVSSKSALYSFCKAIRLEMEKINVYIKVFHSSTIESKGLEIENETKPEFCKFIESFDNSNPCPYNKASILLKSLKLDSSKNFNLFSDNLCYLFKIGCSIENLKDFIFIFPALLVTFTLGLVVKKLYFY